MVVLYGCGSIKDPRFGKKRKPVLENWGFVNFYLLKIEIKDLTTETL
jgi:hypothetical protein